MQTIAAGWLWPSFFIVITIFLAIDIFFLGGKKAHKISNQEAAIWFIIWIGLALLFNCLLWIYLYNTDSLAFANQKALEFFTGFLVEKSLSIDNIFVFIMIFKYFAVPAELQKPVLLWGVLGAIVLRLGMIFLGVWLIIKFHWLMWFFGAFLILIGIKMCFSHHKKIDLNKNFLIQWLRKHLNVTSGFHQERFFIVQKGVWYVTPLFLTLILIELSDIIFALDSIPAIFAITTDPFIVVTSNIFAILGLRSLYFLFANMSDRFQSLNYGIAIILILIGTKMLIEPWVQIPTILTLILIGIILLTCILLHRILNKCNLK